MVPTAPRMVVCDPLIGSRRHLILLAVEVICSFGSHRYAAEPFRRLRRSTRPQHENEHHRANKGGPAVHQWCP